jgi:hypothetical protein
VSSGANPETTATSRGIFVVATSLGFLAYLIAGLLVSENYGVSWDEQVSRNLGQQTLACVLDHLGLARGSPPATLNDQDVGAEYGPAFELVLAALERAFGLEDTRDVLLMRHRVTFLAFWCGAVAFFLLLRRFLASDGLALLGAGFLILTPRLFADSFYNSKDTVLLALFVVSTGTLVSLLERNSVSSAVRHALACAVTIDIRLVGLLLPALTLLFLGVELVQKRFDPARVRRVALASGVYAVSLGAFVVLLWPQLWEAPASRFLDALYRMRDARQFHNSFALYAGSFVPVNELPWHYLPTWIAITTPPVIGGLFLVGLGIALRSLAKASAVDVRNRWLLMFLLLLFVPLGLVIVVRPVLYDGWRHFYFVYPALLAIAMLGVKELCTRPALRAITIGVALLGLGHSLLVVIRYHPHQQVYFNGLVSGDVERRFELDYWGLSFRDGLDAVLERDPIGIVPVAVSDVPGFLNAMILPKAARERILFVPLDQARYFVSNHRNPELHRRFLAGEPPFVNEIYAVRVGGATLLGVYDLR